LDRGELLIQEPSFDPTVHRRAPDADSTRGFSAIAAGVLEELM